MEESSKISNGANQKSVETIILILLLTFFGFLMASEIDLTTADLGRHLKNGEIAIDSLFSGAEMFGRLLKTNFYSYTYPDYPFLNHHWGGGIIFYFVENLFGFTGLSLFYVLLSLFIFFLFFRLAEKNSSFGVAVLTALLLIPLIAERKEVRPEIFTYLFLALFFWILWHYQKGLTSARSLVALPIMGIVWVNTHIFFVLGLFLTGVFLMEKIFTPAPRDARVIRNLILTLALTAFGFLVNPAGLKGALHPFHLFLTGASSVYRLTEEQSVWFLRRIGIIDNPNLLLFEIVFLALLSSFLLLVFINRREFSFVLFLLGINFGIMAALMLRNFTLFGLFALVVLSYNFHKIFQKLKFTADVKQTIAIISFFGVIVFTVINNRGAMLRGNVGFGLDNQTSAAAEFFKEQKIQGPIFNNYDIGGYLIYYLYPETKVFVDNRPEVYPASFFNEIYIPFQENEERWREGMARYNFNAIFFYRLDYTPRAQPFLIRRVSDPLWAPVFADERTIIFVRRNGLNQSTVDKYELPKERFIIYD